ncbi:MAG: 30S ribosomal protein S8 [Candidatus Sungbacteria bacterium]|nr:30S ribosomal protein S8 [Candidatus Sungbacteria bacterium]
MSVVTDPIGDMLVQLKNAYRAKKSSVIIPHSLMKECIARVLEVRGYIAGFEKKGKKIRKFMDIALKYSEGVPALLGARRISKPSRRLYVKAAELRPVKYGHGIALISTSHGIMSGDEARAKKLGGEIICEVW